MALGQQEQTPRTWGDAISSGVVGVFVGTVLLGAWIVVGVAIAILFTSALDHGIGQVGALGLAIPTAFLPAWRTWAAVRGGQGIVGLLKAHLWVLNGAIGYAILGLGLLSIRSVLVDTDGSSAATFVVAGAAGFVFLFGGLVAFNWWLFRMVGKAQGLATVPAESNEDSNTN